MSNVSVKIKKSGDNGRIVPHQYGRSIIDDYSIYSMNGQPTYEMEVRFNSPSFFVRHTLQRCHELAYPASQIDQIMIDRLTDEVVHHIRGEIKAEVKRMILDNREIRPEDYSRIINK